MKTVLILAAAALLAGCDYCEPKFSDGEFVKHRLLKALGTGLVLKSSDYTNYEAYCTVDVRWEDGNVKAVTVDELEKAL